MMLNGQDAKALKRFLNGTANGHNSGQSLVEFALMLPLLFFLVLNAVNFGGFLYAGITVANAARTGAQYAILGGASLGMPSAPTAKKITNLIKTDISSLSNTSSLQVSICTRSGSGYTSLPATGAPAEFTGTCTSLPSDVAYQEPEAPSYVLAAIDVAYTYQPFIAAFEFPNLGISLSNIFSPSMTIHRRTYMRIIQ